MNVPSHNCGWPEEFRLSLSYKGKMLAYTTGHKPGDWQNKYTHVYTIPVNGGEPKELTEQGTQEPTFSPDGSKIAYVHCYKDSNARYYYSNICVIPVKGGNPVHVSSFQSGQTFGPVWSPDGKMIAFLRRPEGQNPKEVWIAPVTDKGNPSAPAQKIDLPLESFHGIAGWTPDNKIGIQLMNPEYEIIYTVPSSGGIATQVTPQGWNSYPKWSPDGEKIFFRGDRGKIAYVSAEGGAIDSIPIQSKYEIFTAVPGSGNEISPDGKTIVFSGGKVFYENGEKKWNVNIYTIPVEGGKPKQLTEVAVELQDRFPCWSPDGNLIAFIRPEIKNGNHIMLIYTVSKDGKNLKKISIEADNVTWAPIDWTPDGKYITFFTNRNTIRSIPVEGGKSIFITNVDSVNCQFDLAWSPDGKKLAYTDQGKLWIYTIGTGATKEVKTGVDAGITKIGWSPDGEKIAFTAYSGGDNELWMMENFLPLKKLAQNKVIKSAKEPEGIRIRQISKKPYLDDLGTVSADGRWLSCVDWGEGDLAIRNLETGQKKLLTKQATLKENPQKFVIASAISKNGKQVAYSWFRPYHTFDLHIFDVEKNSSRLIYKEKGVEAYPVTWLSDTKLIVIRQDRNIEKTYLTVFNVNDGYFRDLKKFDKRAWFGLCSSPDKKFIAYNAHENNADNSNIHLLSADGKSEFPLVTHPAEDKVLGWIPGGKEFLFISNRAGTWDLWSQELEDGKLIDNPKRIYIDIGDVNPIGMTNDGACYFGFSRRNFNTYIVPFNENTGQIGQDEGKTLLGSNFVVDWSPDGNSIAYIKEDKSLSLMVSDINSGSERQLAKELSMVVAPKWSPDGKTIFVFGRDEDKMKTKGYKGGFYTVDVKTGKAKEVCLLTDFDFKPSEDDALPVSGHEWSRDGKSIYFLFHKDRIFKYNLATGEENIICRQPGLERFIFDISLNRKKLLFAASDPKEEKSRLYTIPVNGGDANEICQIQSINYSTTAFWDKIGKYIYFTETDDGTTLWRVSAEGGTPEKVWQTDKRAEMFSIHPSGKQIAYSVRERTTQVKVIEGLKQELDKIYNQNE